MDKRKYRNYLAGYSLLGAPPTNEPGGFLEVVGAKLHNGLLTIDLVKEIPEAMKPKKYLSNRIARSNVTGKK